MEGFFWVGRPTSTTNCASLAWHFAHTAYQSCKQRLFSACKHVLDFKFCTVFVNTNVIEVNGLVLAEREF